MISKERLKELIEQGATIWSIEWGEIKLSIETCNIYNVPSITGNGRVDCLTFIREDYPIIVDIQDLEEFEKNVENAKKQKSLRMLRNLKIETLCELIYNQDKIIAELKKDNKILKRKCDSYSCCQTNQEYIIRCSELQEKVEELESKLKNTNIYEYKLALAIAHTDMARLEDQLANAIVLPKELQVGNKIFWANENGCYSGKIYAITKDINYKEDSFNIWIYCVYNNGLTFYHLIKDYGVELFATEEEAQAKLKEIQGE